jgi:predicted DNA-binding ArsR family transcriptional regulator
VQSLERGRFIENDDQKNGLLNVLADDYSRQIINQIVEEKKSAVQISQQTGIPPSTVYRKIMIMSNLKLLKTSGIISQEGKKIFLYQSKIKSVNAKFECGFVNMEIIPNSFTSNL